jgi:hypothetical protein
MQHIYKMNKLQWEYFPFVTEGLQLLWNLFMFSVTDQGLLTKLYEELTDISADTFLKDPCINVSMIKFGLV